MSLPKIEIRSDGAGVGSVVVDGQDISRLITPRVTMRLDRDQISTVEVAMLGAVTAQVVGEVILDDFTRDWLKSIGWIPPEDTLELRPRRNWLLYVGPIMLAVGLLLIGFGELIR